MVVVTPSRGIRGGDHVDRMSLDEGAGRTRQWLARVDNGRWTWIFPTPFSGYGDD